MMIKPSCYSCRQRFEPAALRLHYSKNYCERCGVGLFGEAYHRFPQKPAPTVQRNLVVHLAVIVFGAVGFWLFAQAFFDLSP